MATIVATQDALKLQVAAAAAKAESAVAAGHLSGDRTAIALDGMIAVMHACAEAALQASQPRPALNRRDIRELAAALAVAVTVRWWLGAAATLVVTAVLCGVAGYAAAGGFSQECQAVRGGMWCGHWTTSPTTK